MSDKQKIRLGNSIESNEKQVGEAYDALDYILDETDFIKKQNYIIDFVNLFTRPAIAGEDKSWFYNKENNKKLLPTFLYELAKTWIENQDYVLKLHEICKHRGTISDDGDCWVDKFSGYKICDISFNDDEGFDDSGFKINTKSLLKEELAYVDTSSNKIITPNKEEDHVDVVVIKKALKHIKHSDIIISIVNAVYKQIGVDETLELEFIVHHVSQFVKKYLKSKPNYEKYKQTLQAKYKDKYIPSYEDYFYLSLFVFTISFKIGRAHV